MLLEKLIKQDLQRVMSLTPNELRLMCVELSVQEGSKDNVIKGVSSVLLNEDIEIIDWIQMMLNSIKE